MAAEGTEFEGEIGGGIQFSNNFNGFDYFSGHLSQVMLSYLHIIINIFDKGEKP